MNKKHRRIQQMLSVITAVVISTLVFTSCKPKTVTQWAVATFIVGDVKLDRPGETLRQVKFKERLRKGDVITTGAGAMFAFQYGENSVIKVQENSVLKINAVFEEGRNSCYLENGKVLSTVKKLDKGESMAISTRTSLAAVRGTDFSVAYDRGQSVVAVNEGAVKVRAVKEGENIEELEKELVAEEEDEKEVAEEKKKKKEVREVKAGNAVVVDVKVETRPITEQEKEEFKKNEKIDVIVNVEKKTEKDIQKIQVKIMKGDDDSAEDGEGRDSDLEEDEMSEEEAGQEKAGGSAFVGTSRKVYKPNEKIVIYYSNMPKRDTCWISVAKSGASGRQFVHYDWTYGKPKGQMVFQDLNLKPGAYEVRAHFSRKHDINKRNTFTVVK